MQLNNGDIRISPQQFLGIQKLLETVIHFFAYHLWFFIVLLIKLYEIKNLK